MPTTYFHRRHLHRRGSRNTEPLHFYIAAYHNPSRSTFSHSAMTSCQHALCTPISPARDFNFFIHALQRPVESEEHDGCRYGHLEPGPSVLDIDLRKLLISVRLFLSVLSIYVSVYLYYRLINMDFLSANARGIMTRPKHTLVFSLDRP
ncbi:hypothetical protein KSP40_PGU003505 [Platanthera guangdongensis]|uniref:Uncharacterized protein n=1 Tax=Platanthera guangdongensis TaxID=2320717 RepID=A0ABR2LES1_9ASPA